MRKSERLLQNRRGAATLWLVIWIPCLLILFCMLLGAANLWLARVELESALESAALAAATHWGKQGGGDTQESRDVGVAFAEVCGVRGQSLMIGTNYASSPGGGPNRNDECDLGMDPPTANLIFGAIDDSNPSHIVFDAGEAPSCGGGDGKFGVRAQAQVCIPPLGRAFLGSLGPFCVQAKATAEYDCATQRVRLIRVDEFICQ